MAQCDQQSKKKEEYYMGLTREILIHKNKEVKNIEEISNLLINQADTKTESERIEMIQRYKENIILLLEELQKVKEKYYGIKGELEMDTILFNKFIYHFDTLKYRKDLVEKINHLDRDNLYYYTKQELQHKNYSEEKICLLVNSDIYQRLSGSNTFLYEEKNFYQNEIARLTEINMNLTQKKKKYKLTLKDKTHEFDQYKTQAEDEIVKLNIQLAKEKVDSEAQTDTDYYKYNKLIKNNELITIHKKLTKKTINDYIERIKFSCTKTKPISKISLLKLIPEIITEKKESDEENERNKKMKLTLADFLINYIQKKLKLHKIVKQNTEGTIMSILKYSSEDIRIDYFRRFIGLGEDHIR